MKLSSGPHIPQGVDTLKKWKLDTKERLLLGWTSLGNDANFVTDFGVYRKKNSSLDFNFYFI